MGLPAKEYILIPNDENTLYISNYDLSKLCLQCYRTHDTMIGELSYYFNVNPALVLFDNCLTHTAIREFQSYYQFITS